MRVTVYGPGGYDPDLPNNNVVEDYEVPAPPAEPAASVEQLREQLASLQAQLDALEASSPPA